MVPKINPTTANSKKAAAQARARPVSNPAVKFEKMNVGSVARSPENGLTLVSDINRVVNRSGAVSPTTLATPKRIAVISPAFAVGIIT